VWLLLLGTTSAHFTRTTRAQGTLNFMQKAQYLQAAVAAIQEKQKAGDKARVRMMLIGTATLARPMFAARTDKRIAPIVNAWLAAHEWAWPGQTKLAPGELVGLHATIKANITRLGQIAQECQTVPQMMPNGVMDYRRFVANAVTQREATWAFLDTIAMQSPPPILLMQDQLVWQNLATVRPYFQVFYNSFFGPSLLIGVAKQRVVPEALAAVEKIIAEAAESKKPSTIWGDLDKAIENLDLVSSVEVSLRGEGPQVAMPDVAKKVEELRAAVKKQDERATEIKDREIDANRMPKSSWRGGGGAAILGKLKKAYASAFPKESILRMVLTTSETSERWESIWNGRAVITSYASYITAASAVKQKSGSYHVFKCRYVRTRKANGSWTSWRYHSHIMSYRIRKQNIKK
jgi:hypothetical protein